MIEKRLLMRVFAGVVLVGAVIGGSFGRADEKEKKPTAKKSGTVVGTLTAKGPNWIEVRADGEEKARRYVPHWRGGLPKDGGGPDKKMAASIKETPLKARVRLEWSFEE